MKVTGRKIITVLFTATVIISIATLIGPTTNYTHFYKAVEKLRLYMSDFHFDAQQKTFSAVLIVANNESYSGLKIRSLRYSLAVLAKDDDMISLTGGQLWWEPTPLKPNSNFTWPLTNQPVTGSGAEALNESLQEGKINLVVSGDAIIHTFVGYGTWVDLGTWTYITPAT